MTAAPRKRAAKAAPTRKGNPVSDDTKPSTDPEPLARIEDADADNLMINAAGDRFFPDGPEDAHYFALNHGATIAHPDRWPWPPEAPPESVEEFDPTAHCPTPGYCFPYGLGSETTHAVCIHGESRHPSLDAE